jgi:hypothetical protein
MKGSDDSNNDSKEEKESIGPTSPRLNTIEALSKNFKNLL